MLACEKNTRTIERRIRAAFVAQSRASWGRRPSRFSADFEHGQWWITVLGSGAQFAVNDANTESGFDFEQVTRGDED